MHDGNAVRISTKTLNPKPLSIISGHFHKQKTTQVTVLMSETSIVGFGRTTLGKGDLSCRKVAKTARRYMSYRVS